MLYVLLLFGVVVAVLGIINTLALSVFERTREIGRASGLALMRWPDQARWLGETEPDAWPATGSASPERGSRYDVTGHILAGSERPAALAAHLADHSGTAQAPRVGSSRSSRSSGSDFADPRRSPAVA